MLDPVGSVEGDRFWRARIQSEQWAAHWHAKGKPAGGLYKSMTNSALAKRQPHVLPSDQFSHKRLQGTAFALMATNLESPDAKKLAMDKMRTELGLRAQLGLHGNNSSERALARWTMTDSQSHIPWRRHDEWSLAMSLARAAPRTAGGGLRAWGTEPWR